MNPSYDDFEATHRCKKSLELHKAIRYYNSNSEFVIPSTIKHGWYLLTLDRDYDYDWTGLTALTVIDYCPFCGVLLNGD